MLSSLNLQMDDCCVNAEQSDAAKLYQRLNTDLQELCRRMPELCARLVEKYPSIEEAIDEAKKISDQSFVELSEEGRDHVRRDCLYSSLGQI